MVHGPKAMLSQLPSVDRLINLPECAALLKAHGTRLVTVQARALLQDWREALLAGQVPEGLEHPTTMVAQLKTSCEQRLAPRMRRVINMTGTVIHTNLGRAVLAQEAIDHVASLMRAPNNLEYDLERGSRGDRDSLIEGLLCEITGAEAATVVNNNAAAVLLTLAALAPGKEAVVSRGEQVEIGGAFRMPDVMASAGARMVEVGTTNRTHLADYARAIGPDTALLMKVHTSNYAVQGFTSSVSEAELSPLARERGVILVTDLGSGSLIDMSALGLPYEPTPQDMLSAGCDIVTFSGDKLLGGPQAGLIVGRRDLIERIKRFPMKRALRLSKLPLAALEATLRLYLQPDRLLQQLPTLRWLTRSAQDTMTIAEQLLPVLSRVLAERYVVTTATMMSQIGSGSLPVDQLPSAGLKIAPQVPGKKGVGTALEALATALRQLPVPIIGRIDDDCLWLDCRCLDDLQEVERSLQQLRWESA
jgi:L-seryl-tRNA(Ser) seleniumtransferase